MKKIVVAITPSTKKGSFLSCSESGNMIIAVERAMIVVMARDC